MRRFWGLVVEVWQAVPNMLFGPYVGREEAVVRFKAVVPSVDEQAAWIEGVTLLAQAGWTAEEFASAVREAAREGLLR